MDNTLASASIDPSLIQNYFDRLLAIQSSLKELQREYQQLLKDAEVDGLDRKALNPLVNMVATESKPRAQQLLNTMIEYGKYGGLEVNAGADMDDSTFELNGQNKLQPNDPESQMNIADNGKLITKRFSILIQTFIGFSAGGTLIWLLH